MRGRSSPRLLALLVALGLAGLVALGGYVLNTPSNVIVLNPDRIHPAADVVSVAGAQPARSGHGGGIFYLDVLFHRASLAESWLVRFERGASTYDAEAYLPHGGEQEERRIDRAAIEDSKRVAAYVAERALGRPASVIGGGVRITSVSFASARRAGVRRGQVIVGVDGTRVRSIEDLQGALAGARIGQRAQLRVREGGRVRALTVRLGSDRLAPGRPLIGVTVEGLPYHVQLPVRVRYDTGSLGGPSAGLAFALQIYDALTQGKLTRERRIAVTGTIALNGAVGPIGGMRQKAISAREGDADLLLVPPANAAEARRFAGAVPVVAVSTFRQALDVLRSGGGSSTGSGGR